MSSQKVEKLSSVLLSAGGERRQQMFHDECASISKPGGMSKCNATIRWCPDEQNPELQKAQLHYYGMLRKLIDKRLSNPEDAPDEAASLAKHMREARMMQLAGGRILFLDGGGLRGLMHVDILSQVIHGNNSEIFRAS